MNLAPELWIPILAAFGGTLLAAAALGPIARRLGWADRPGVGDAHRKPQARAVPTFGGAALFCGLAAGWVAVTVLGRGEGLVVPGRALGRLVAGALGDGATLFPLGGCLVAFGVGLLDDLLEGGLRPVQKLAGQALSGLVLGAPLLWSVADPGAALGALLSIVLGALVATNAVNTFDNADGAATSIALLGLGPTAPLFGAPLAAFLPFNLRLGRRGTGEGRPPRAYLGDAGSHLVGMWILLVPAAWPVLAIPLFDLARVALERHRSGRAPWVGDRTHLAHLFAARGLAPWLVCAALVLLALPAVALAAGGAAWIGWALSALAFGVALRAVRRIAP